MGLRPRFVLALVLTGAVTLAVAALTILSPLQRRLRQDAATTLVVAVDSARTSYADLLAEHDTPAGRRALIHLDDSLTRRTGAATTLLTAAGEVIHTTDRDEPSRLADAAHALQRNRTTRRVVADDLVVAAPVRDDRRRRYAIVLRKRLNDVRSATRVVKNSALVAAAAALAVALLLGVGLSTALLTRLRRLHAAVTSARELGFDAPPPPHDGGRDEIGQLSRAYAAMQGDVRRQEEARRAFVATASHELRTPVASLQVGLELLTEELAAASPDLGEARAQARRAHAQSTRLGHLAHDLLDLSRLDAEVQMRGEPVELDQLAHDVAAEFAARAAESRTAIHVAGDGALWALGDPDAIARIVRLLIDNALRFSPAGEQVTVSISGGAGGPRIAVADAGPGVPDDERELIFERFRRGTRTGDAGGFGLGLTIGRELARRMDGSLELGRPPHGALFVLRLRPPEPGSPADD